MRFGLREIVFILLLAAVPVGAYLFVFEPRQEQIDRVTAEIRKKRTKLAELESATRRMPDLGREIDRLKGAIEQIEVKLPDERKFDEVLKQVWELAARQRLTPKSIRTEKPVPAAQYSELPISMEIIGDFDSFYSFMLELEKLPRITRMRQLKLAKKVNKDDDPGQVQAKFVLSVFFESSDSETTDGRPRL